MPYRYDTNCVVYTGTHDNETLKGWFDNLGKKRVAYIEKYLKNACGRKDTVCWDIIRLAMMSSANLCVIPMQDYLMLGNEARMNHPSTMGNNWKWRMGSEDFSDELIARVRQLTLDAFRLIEEESGSDEEDETVTEISETDETEDEAVKEASKADEAETEDDAEEADA